MKNIGTLFIALFLALVSWQCEQPIKGTLIEGNIKDAGNLQAFLDKVVIGKASNILAKADINASGQFQMEFPEGLEPGIYQLRIGAKRINLIMDGSEKKVSITGGLSNLESYQATISGSGDSQALASIMQGLYARKVKAEDVATYVDTVSNPLSAAYVAYRALGAQGEFLDIQKKAYNRLANADPTSEMSQEYGKFIAVVERQYQNQMASQLIQIGQPAPNIELPGPNGKEYALADLRGKIVLLDFWASWCGPCRRENPNVVEVYDRYKNQGFTVFSVSLDGMDSRTRNRFSTEDQAQQYVSSQKDRWVQAISEDNLKWKYHVSDLRKWESAPAATYGVRSIPRTFLIDREGKIAAVNLRGADEIERALKKLL